MRPACPLSVIIPVAPGDQEWRGLLEQLAPALPDGAEVLLLGAADPPAWPARLALHAAPGQRGRAGDLNDGAARAQGRWLWFVHADSRLSPATMPAVARFIRGGDALGWLDLRFRGDGPAVMALNAWGANLRSRWLGLPFGDQGFVLPAHCFAALGGFDEAAAYGEDHLLVWAAWRHGLAVRRIGAPLSTSARKYRRHGWARTTLRHVALTAIQAWREWRRPRPGQGPTPPPP